MPGITNTLIVTRIERRFLENPDIIARALAAGDFRVELVCLPKFARFIIICTDQECAIHVKEHLVRTFGSQLHVLFSMRDNELRILRDELWALEEKKEYLELPLEESSRRFLILPPQSPQSGWNDYHRVEEGPNKQAVFSPDEISHLLWDRFGGFNSTQVSKFQDEGADLDAEVLDISEQPEVLFKDITNDVPAIVVDSVKNRSRGEPTRLPRTSLPPVN